MPALTQHPNRAGRRLAGAVLSAVTMTGIAVPAAVWMTGLVLGPQALRQKIIVTANSFSAVYGRTSILIVMAATFAVLVACGLIFGQRASYARGTMLPALFDDALSVREKLTVLLTSVWGWLTLALNLFWILLALPIFP